MRIVIVMILIGALGGLAWWWTERRDPAQEAEATSRATSAALARIGVRRMLTGHDVFRFSEIVLTGPIGDGIFDFRGFVETSGKTTPAFGQARSTCTEGVDQASCWEIVYLEVDGSEIDLAPPPEVSDEPATLPAAETAVTEAAEGATDASAGEGRGPDAAPDPATVPAASEAPAEPASDSVAAPTAEPEPALDEAAALPPPTHRVARPLINTRSGPGTDNPVLATMTEGQSLALIEEEGGWGRFVILDGDDAGTEVWVALSILEDLRR